MKNRPTICFILPHFFKEHMGGAELQAYYLAMEFLKKGWQVHYIREYLYKTYQRDYTYNGIFIHGIDKKRPIFQTLNWKAFCRILNEIKADFWYCRACLPFLYPVLKSARRMNCGKVVWACSHENELKPGLPKRLHHKVETWITRRLFFKPAVSWADKILLQTEDQNRLLKRHFNLSGKVIYNAHPLPEDRPAIHRKPLILWIGRLQTWKHPEIFIALARRLQHKSYSFLLIGKNLGLGNIEATLIQANKNQPNFTYAGELKNEQVCQLLSTAKLLINTSEHEGFSNTFIEAWSRGVPVISLNVDPDNLISDYDLGSHSVSFDRLCLDTEHLMENTDDWKTTSDNCARFFQTRLTIDRAANELENILLDL